MARTEPAATHGWFPDPDGSGQLRMWDGHAWTKLTKYPSIDDTVTATSPPPPHEQPRRRPSPVRQDGPTVEPRRRVTPAAAAPHQPDSEPPTELARFAHENRYALLTVGIAIVYIIVAAATKFIYAGLLPIGLGIRAYQLREPSAPVAVLAAVAVLVVSLVLRT